jgi:hypothetical protein
MPEPIAPTQPPTPPATPPAEPPADPVDFRKASDAEFKAELAKHGLRRRG